MSVIQFPNSAAPASPAADRAGSPHAQHPAGGPAYSLLLPGGKFDREAINARRDELFARHADFLAQYEGEVREKWARALLAEAVRKAEFEAADEQWHFVQRRAVITFTADERTDLNLLRGYMDSRPMNALGNEDWNRAAALEAHIRNTARMRAILKVHEEIQKELEGH